MTYSLTLKNLKFKINSLEDLPMLKLIMESNNLKPNYSKIARELGIDRRTVKKYYDGYSKPVKRNKTSRIDAFKEIITELLDENCVQRFHSKRILWTYLKDNYGLDVSESNFRKYISNNEQFQEYFDGKKGRGKLKARLRFETLPGDQAQIDWKEDVEYITKDGEILNLNVFVFQLSYSRYRLFHVSQNRKQNTVFDFLTKCFEHIGGVPKTIVCDNMRTIMENPRSANSEGKVNNKFYEYMTNFGFQIVPCTSYRPETKGKVESTMKLLEEIHAYQGKYDMEGLNNRINLMNNRINLDIHKGTGEIPLKLLEKDKDLLKPLPNGKIRDLYKTIYNQVKVNKSCMITYKSNQYSVPPEYENKTLNIMIEDNYLYLYDNTNYVTKHKISNKKDKVRIMV